MFSVNFLCPEVVILLIIGPEEMLTRIYYSGLANVICFCKKRSLTLNLDKFISAQSSIWTSFLSPLGTNQHIYTWSSILASQAAATLLWSAQWEVSDGFMDAQVSFIQ